MWSWGKATAKVEANEKAKAEGGVAGDVAGDVAEDVTGKAVWEDAGTSEPELARYAPFAPERAWLVMCVTHGRLPMLAEPAVTHLWQAVLLETHRSHPFVLHGYVTLSDHAHLLLTPDAGRTVEAVVRHTVQRFERDFRTMRGLPDSAPFWSPRQRIDRIDDLAQFAAAVDYVHFNPVQHGVARRPEAWPAGSYAAWIERKVYKLGWGWTKPRRIVGKQWE